MLKKEVENKVSFLTFYHYLIYNCIEQ